jgi:hypothetical protein
MATNLTKSFVAPPTFSERMSKEQEFFNNEFLMSYSGLNKLMHSPALFYQHYILKQREDTTDPGVIEGSLIHCLLLKPESFDATFALSVANLPNENQRKVVDTVYAHIKELRSQGDSRTELVEYPNAIIDVLKDMNLYQTLKTDVQRLDKIIGNPKAVEYYNMLRSSESKIIISQETYDFCKQVVDKITTNPIVMDAMGYFADMFNGITKHNEIELVAFNSEYSFGLRGFIDNLVFDPVLKVIRINDVKKTSKALSNFEDSIDYFRYWLQASIYYMLVEHTYKSMDEYKDWDIEFRFIVIDPYMQIAPIKVSQSTMDEWLVASKEELRKANYHFKERSFELPYEFLLNKELTI